MIQKKKEYRNKQLNVGYQFYINFKSQVSNYLFINHYQEATNITEWEYQNYMPVVQLRRSPVGKEGFKELLTIQVFKDAGKEINVSTISFCGGGGDEVSVLHIFLFLEVPASPLHQIFHRYRKKKIKSFLYKRC